MALAGVWQRADQASPEPPRQRNRLHMKIFQKAFGSRHLRPRQTGPLEKRADVENTAMLPLDAWRRKSNFPLPSKIFAADRGGLDMSGDRAEMEISALHQNYGALLLH